jgi:hypothetical protein
MRGLLRKWLVQVCRICRTLYIKDKVWGLKAKVSKARVLKAWAFKAMEVRSIGHWTMRPRRFAFPSVFPRRRFIRRPIR